MKHKFSLNKFRMLSVFVILTLVSGYANASPASSAAAPYTLIDLGTLGGRSSFANAINEAGQVIGYSFLTGNTSYHAFVWEGGVMTDLGTLGGSRSEALAINEAGQVIGYSTLVGDTSQHAFLWESGVMTDLGTLGSNNSYPVAINEAGQVIGYAYQRQEDATTYRAFVWEDEVMTELTLGGSYSYPYAINEAGQVIGTAQLAGDTIQRGFLWEGGVMTDPGTLGGKHASAIAINEAGQVVGGSYLAGDIINHAFVWEGGVKTDLGTLGGGYSSPVAINEAGQVIGDSTPAGDIRFHAFLWEGGVMTDLGTLGGSHSHPVAINEAGQIIGFSDLAGDTSRHGVVWENGVMTELTLGGSHSHAAAINEAGQVIGASYLAGDTSYHAFLWEGGVMTDLGTFGGTISSALDINQAGQIVGFSSLAGDTSYHAFVTTPVTNQLPTVNAGGPYSINEGGSISVTASGTDPEGGPLTHAWDLDNDGIFETPDQSATFSATSLDGPNSHTIAVQVTDDGGLTATDQATVNIINVAPKATFAGMPGTLIEGQSATLVFSNPFDPGTADTAFGFLYSYDCTNDNTFELSGSAATSYACAYPVSGDFTARGHIQDKDGGFTDYTVQITVLTTPANQPPTANAGGPYTVNEGASVTVTASGTDPEGGTLTYAWDLDDDGIFQTPGQSVTFSAASLDGPSSYTITVQVTDNGGLTATGQATVNVLNVAPSATPNAPANVDEGSGITLSLNDPTDPSDADTVMGFTYAFDCGDGNGYGSFSLASSVSCPTDDNGIRVVGGKIRDQDNGESEYAATVTIDNVAPTASFANTSGTLIAGQSATLVFSNPFDPGAADTSFGFLYSYDCTNDGAFELGDSAAPSYACAYPTSGEVAARGRIQDKDGGFTDYAIQVRVLPANQPPTASAGGPYSLGEGASISVAAFGSDPEGGTVTYAWDLDNDGIFESPGQSATFSAVILDGPSSHTLTVLVTDSGGLTTTASTIVDVLNVAPTASLASTPDTLLEGQSAILAFSNPFDPGAADAATGFLYSYDCTNDGTFELADASVASHICEYLVAGTFIARGRIADKDGDYTDYTVQVTVLTPQQGIEGLIQQVQTLIPGSLNGGQGNALIAKLEAALRQLDRGNVATAINQLQAFVNQVNALIGSGVLSPADGEPLIDAANAILAALGG